MRAGGVVERLAVGRIELENSLDDGVGLFLPAETGITLRQPAQQHDIVEIRLELPTGDLDDLQRRLVGSLHLPDLPVQPGEILPGIVVMWSKLRGPPIPRSPITRATCPVRPRGH